MGNNGFHENDELNDIADDMVEDRDSNHPKNVLDASNLENIFSFPQNADLARTLLEPGNSLDKLLMKGKLPNTRTAIAIASLYGKCLKHGNTRIPQELRMIIAALCGVNSERAQLVGDVIVGERQRSSRIAGFGEKLKKMVYGNSD
jgi:hypothetical protein